MFGIEQKVAAAARKGALLSASAVLASVGAAFLTAAAWLLLSELKTALFAATVIGAVYMGLALIGIAMASSSPAKPVVAQAPSAVPPEPLSPLQLIVVSFMQGIEQGARSNRKL